MSTAYTMTAHLVGLAVLLLWLFLHCLPHFWPYALGQHLTDAEPWRDFVMRFYSLTGKDKIHIHNNCFLIM